MKNRNNFLGYLVALILGVMFYACSQDNYAETLDSKESNYEIVGRLHNEGLDYVLQELKKNELQTRSQRNIVITTRKVQELCENFVKEKGYPIIHKVTTKADNLSMDHRKLEFNFSDRQNDYLERLKKILSKAKPDQFLSAIKKIKRLESELLNDTEISSVEREPLLYGMATCRYSAKYWAENYEKWMVELQGINSQVLTKTTTEYTVSPSWWDRFGSTVTADGWWAMQGFLQSGSSLTPWYIIGMTAGSGIAGSVLVNL